MEFLDCVIGISSNDFRPRHLNAQERSMPKTARRNKVARQLIRTTTASASSVRSWEAGIEDESVLKRMGKVNRGGAGLSRWGASTRVVVGNGFNSLHPLRDEAGYPSIR